MALPGSTLTYTFALDYCKIAVLWLLGLDTPGILGFRLKKEKKGKKKGKKKKKKNQ